MKILMVLTSYGQLGDSGKKTGFWLDEFAAPYYVFTDAGVAVTLASPKGGQPPLDPGGDAPDVQTDATRRFAADAAAQSALAGTLKLCDVAATDFDAVFYPCGLGPLWDLAEDSASVALIEALLAAGKPVAAVCHAPDGARQVKGTDGTPVAQWRAVTGFTQSTEEQAFGLTQAVPFMAEDRPRAGGGAYSKVADWQSLVITDGRLVTGQNPASSEQAANAMLDMMR
jgi:putative intracellular protease/amidase